MLQVGNYLQALIFSIGGGDRFGSWDWTLLGTESSKWTCFSTWELCHWACNSLPLPGHFEHTHYPANRKMNNKINPDYNRRKDRYLFLRDMYETLPCDKLTLVSHSFDLIKAAWNIDSLIVILSVCLWDDAGVLKFPGLDL